MAYWEIFFSAEYFSTLVLISLLYPLAFWWFAKLEDEMTGHPVSHFLMDAFGRPVLQALLVLLFVYLAYPKLFGLYRLPGFNALLAAEGRTVNSLLNLLVALGFFLPALPLLRRFAGIVLSLQIIIACQVVFFWAVASVRPSLQVRFVPDWPFVLQLGVAALAVHFTIALCGKHLGDWLDERFDTDGMDILVEMSAGFFLQGLVILSYTLFLGMQLGM
ncbi:MAG: hypothetical protein ACU826_03505 [Gammaproteobacteria bacterium]